MSRRLSRIVSVTVAPSSDSDIRYCRSLIDDKADRPIRPCNMVAAWADVIVASGCKYCSTSLSTLALVDALHDSLTMPSTLTVEKLVVVPMKDGV